MCNGAVIGVYWVGMDDVLVSLTWYCGCGLQKLMPGYMFEVMKILFSSVVISIRFFLVWKYVNMFYGIDDSSITGISLRI